MLSLHSRLAQKRSTHSYEGWVRMKNADGYSKLKKWKRRFITLDGNIIHSYKSAFSDAEFMGEIFNAKPDKEVDTLFKIEVTVTINNKPKNVSFLLEPEENQDKAQSLLVSIATAVAASQAKFMQRGASVRDIQKARKLINQLSSNWGFVEPDRGNLDDEQIRWKHGKPDYTVTNLAYFLGKTKNHTPGSLEMVVENLVKTWEMEATHKPYDQWLTVQHDGYRVSANGGPFINGSDAAAIGNYNWLLKSCPKHLFDADKESFDSSHDVFLKAFPHGFPFEVMEVFSGPPRVSFTWRHWATFSGEFRGNKGSGEIVDLTGFGIAMVSDELKILDLEIFFDGAAFIEVLMGTRNSKELASSGAARGEAVVLSGGCPFSISSNSQHAMHKRGVEDSDGSASGTASGTASFTGVGLPGLNGRASGSCSTASSSTNRKSPKN